MTEKLEVELGATLFALRKGILNSYQVTEVNSIRGPLSEKMAEGTATFHELIKGLVTELKLLDKTKRRVLEDNSVDPEDLDAPSFYLNRILSLLKYMQLNYSVSPEWLADLLPILNSNVTYLKENDLDFLFEIVSKTKDNKYLWAELIEIHVKMNSYEKILVIFKEAVKSDATTDFALPLWNLIIGYLKQYSSPVTLQNTFEAFSKLEFGDVAMEIRFQYFEWFVENHSDIILIRTLFENLKDLHPTSLKMYELMIATEEKQKKPRIITIRQLLVEACKKFGRNETCIWAKRIRFELKTKNPDAATKLMEESLKILRPDLSDAMCRIFVQISSEFKLSGEKN